MSNDPHERFFKLLAKVMMMVVDKKRHTFYVYGVITGERGGAKFSREKSWYQRLNERIATIIETPSYLESAINALQEVIDGPKPVFVEFTVRVPAVHEMEYSTGNEGDKQYFAGTSLQDVLFGTGGGKKSGLWHFSSHRVVDEILVRKTCDSGDIVAAVSAIKEGCWAYSLSRVEA